MSEALPARAPVVVIGGGITGCSTLYHLARKRVEGAVLLERRKIACGTTWHAAGLVGQLRESTAQTELSKYTVALFRELEAETGQGTGYKENGSLHLALSDVRMEQLRRSQDHAVRMGIESHVLSVAEAAELWPKADLTGVRGGFYVPSNGQVNPLDTTLAFARGAKLSGALLFEDTLATRMLIRNGRIAGVETDAGVVETDTVVLCCGIWTARFAKAHGVTVPLHAAEHFYVVTEPIPNLPASLPALVLFEERSYWKEDAGKLLIGGFEARAKPWGAAGISDGFEFDELPFDMEQSEPVLEKVFARMPSLESVGIRTFFTGPESFTPDGRPYIGPAPELPGLFVAAGMNSHGIMNSGGVGLTLAAWIVEGQPHRSVGSMLASRAMPFQCNAAYNEERVTESLGMHWGLHWPGRQTETARQIRRVPLHASLAAAGAKFAERVGWEVPMYFDADAEGWPNRPSMGYQDWSPRVAAEVEAVEHATGLLDQSMFAKILVQGPDAVHALNRVSAAQMDVPIGTSVYAQFLNERGGIEADITATRLSADRFLVLAGHPSQIRDAHWIRAHADRDWRFEVVDMTSAFSLLSLHGPQSRTILAQLSGDDLSNASLPFGGAREFDLAHARVWAIRRSFLGELGFELLIPAEFTAHVYENILAAGTSHGLKHVGMFAMNACRLEKGFRHFGHDIGEDDTPFEAGLGFAVDLSKPEFVGRAALAAQREGHGRATPYRMVAISVPGATEEEGPYLIHNETVWKDGALVGHVTSGGWGYRLGRMLGLASLHHEEGVQEDWIAAGGFEVQIAGERHAAALQLAPLYDPSGTRLRG